MSERLRIFHDVSGGAELTRPGDSGAGDPGDPNETRSGISWDEDGSPREPQSRRSLGDLGILEILAGLSKSLKASVRRAWS